MLEPQAENATDLQSEAPMRALQDVIKPLDDEAADFDFWEDLKASMPPWINEVVGFALIVFGALSFISLYIAADALVAVTWADILTSLFGNGAIFVAGAFFVFGVLLWLPKAGIRFGFSALRMLALEIIFLSLLAILHLGNSDTELRALARAGQGGGLIGWGLSYPFYWILGRPAALVFFSVLTGVCGVVAIGLRRSHLSSLLTGLGGKLRAFSESADQAATTPPEDDESRTIYQRLAGSPAYRAQIMRIRPSPEIPQAPAEGDRQTATTTSNGVARVRSGRASAGSQKREEETVAGMRSAAVDPPDDMGFERRNAPAQTAGPDEEHRGDQAPGRDALPGIDCLTRSDLVLPSEAEINHNAALIQNTLLEFDLETTVIDVHVGPTVTRYALQPHKEDGSDRIRMSRIAAFSRDLSLALAAKRLRMETPAPGTNYMGIEVPNKEPGVVALRNLLESEDYAQERARGRAPLLIPLGRDVAGAPVSVDLTQMPHLLIAGATGSGKSVCMGAIATALLMQYKPDELQFVMLDPKMVELQRFDGIPHLLGPVEIETNRIISVLRWCTREMDRRYKLLEARGARNIRMYNQARAEPDDAASALPYLVILIDEIGDLMLSSPDETERALTRLAQMARAVGMHMVVATQRPSVDVITGLIKANFPARIAFSVASGADSRVIIDRTGAEQLLGSGDMLYLSAEAPEPRRVQGCFVAESDVRVVVDHWRAQGALRQEAGAVPAKKSAPWEQELRRLQFIKDTDPMLGEALRLVMKGREASASLIQRRLGLGYPRAARIMDLLEELGAVGDEIGGGRSRKVIIPPGVDPLQFVYERYTRARS